MKKKISKAKIRSKNNPKLAVWSLTSLNGLVMFVSSCQSMVLQTFRLWSSAWEAMYFPTGSHVRPFTSPVCPFKVITISVAYTYKSKFKNAVFDALIHNWIYWYRSQHFLDVIRVPITVFRQLSHISPKHSFINYSHSFCSTSIRLSFFFKIQMKIFLMYLKDVCPSIENLFPQTLQNIHEEIIK